MKKSINSSFVAPILAGLLLCAKNLTAQTFVGTNVPGQTTNYSFSIGAAATNIFLVISNAVVTHSYSLLAKGRPPTGTDFDFISRLNGAINQIKKMAIDLDLTWYISH